MILFIIPFILLCSANPEAREMLAAQVLELFTNFKTLNGQRDPSLSRAIAYLFSVSLIIRCKKSNTKKYVSRWSV